MIKAWNTDPSASTLQSFMSCISNTKLNIIKWKRSGLGYIDAKLSNIQAKINKIEEEDMNLLDNWNGV